MIDFVLAEAEHPCAEYGTQAQTILFKNAKAKKISNSVVLLLEKHQKLLSARNQSFPSPFSIKNKKNTSPIFF